jgi:hypothetical protein
MGAAGLAAATIVSGLSFGGSAIAAPTTSSSANAVTPTASAARLEGKFLLENGSYFWGMPTPINRGSSWLGRTRDNKSTAESKAGTWSFPLMDQVGEVRSGNICLTISAEINSIVNYTCDGRAAQRLQWVPLTGSTRFRRSRFPLNV